MYVRLGFCIYNTNINSKLEVPISSEGYIINQSKLNEFRFGVLSANKNCCGAIATYNFLKLNGKEPNFKTILSVYDIFGTNVYGTLGVNPFTIKNYLKLNGFNAKISIEISKFEKLARKSKTSILVYLYKWGGHYITINYDEDLNLFATYNLYYGSITYENMSDILNQSSNLKNMAMLIYIC